MIFGEAYITSIPEQYERYYGKLLYNESTGSLEYNGTLSITLTTAWDRAANYSLGVAMLLSFLFSTCLNPLVFYFSYQQVVKLKLTKLLFMMLVKHFLRKISSFAKLLPCV